jgi:hypothetical protein
MVSVGNKAQKPRENLTEGFQNHVRRVGRVRCVGREEDRQRTLVKEEGPSLENHESLEVKEEEGPSRENLEI